MTKEEKKKLLAELENNGMYHVAVQSIANEAERRQVKAFIADVYINLVDSLSNILSSEQEIMSEEESKIIPNE